MNVTFTLDGEAVGSYYRTEVTPGWVYNQSIFTSDELENQEHALVIQPLPGINSSFLAFDYFSYE